ncbi:hypothetical protein CHU98_g544 [Xylaria longipes]|nr:hypothetical protein CHU98_g544 [Xylaria longipes]
MAPQRTKTIKNKHAANKSGISLSKSSKSGSSDGVSKSKKKLTAAPLAKQVKGRTMADLLKKKKKKIYTEKELGIPQLNMITPVGVTKPKGKKKGKIFVDDKESMSTILAMGEKKEAEKKAKLDETKESLRRKRKRNKTSGDDDKDVISDAVSAGTNVKSKKKRVAFA